MRFEVDDKIGRSALDDDENVQNIPFSFIVQRTKGFALRSM